MLFREYDLLEARQKMFLDEWDQTINEGVEEHLIHPIQREIYFREDFTDFYKNQTKVYSYLFYTAEAARGFKVSIHWEKQLIPSYLGEMDYFIKEVKNYLLDNQHVFIFSGTEQKRKGLDKLLTEHGIRNPLLVLSKGVLRESFKLPNLNLVCIGEKTIFGVEKQLNSKKKKTQKRKIDPFVDIKEGLYCS